MELISICFCLGAEVQVQEKLVDPKNHLLKPSTEFLESFAGVVGSKWPSLAVSLGLTEKEMEELKTENLSTQDSAGEMLTRWASRDEATYGLLCLKLRTISLFNYIRE